MPKPTLSSFNMLASVFVQRYERYLPTAFDESMSLLEKVNKIIHHLHETDQLVNEVVEQWNEVMNWVMGEGLHEVAEEKIEELLESGYFNDLIHTLFGDSYNYASLKHNVKLGAYLDIFDIMQTCVFDKKNQCLYVAYEDQHKRFSTPTMIIAKLNTTGQLLGEMFFQNIGHGDGFNIDLTNSKNMILNLSQNGNYMTVRTAFTNGQTINDLASQTTVLTQFGGRDWKLSFNEEQTVFTLMDANDPSFVNVYEQNILNVSSLPSPTRVIALDASARPYQGMAVGRKSIFVLTGVDGSSSQINQYPHKIWEYEIATGNLINSRPLIEFVSMQSSNGYSEPEGLQVVLDENYSEILLVGYVRGQFRQRINEIYEISAKGTDALTRRISRGYYRENGGVKGIVDDANQLLSDIFETGAWTVNTAKDTPTGRRGFLYNDVSYDGVDILQTYVSSAGLIYTRWIYWSNATKTITDWIDYKTNANFARDAKVNATLMTGVSNGSFFDPIYTYRERTPIGHRAYLEGTFTIDSAVLPITGGWKKIAKVSHVPYYKVPLTVTSFSGANNNVMGYIDTDGSVYVQGSGATSGYYTFGTVTYPIAVS